MWRRINLIAICIGSVIIGYGFSDSVTNNDVVYLFSVGLILIAAGLFSSLIKWMS